MSAAQSASTAQGGRLVVLASGGTGGHVFPAQSLASVLQQRGHRVALVTDHRLSGFHGALAEVETFRIEAAGMSGRSLAKRAGAVMKLGVGFLQARRILSNLQPAAVVGFGSYPSVPTMLAALSLRIGTAIHEQNAIFGRANRMLAPRVDRIATAFRTVVNMREDDRDKTVWTGNPVRPEVVALRDAPYPRIDETSPIRLLVFGGSQGATVFSQVVPEALIGLEPALRQRIRVVQQCRAEEVEAVARAYREAGVEANVASFFDDLPAHLGAAHLVICRSGASTLAEVTTAGRPAILVPFPHATDDHQTANAEGLCDSGGGWMFQQELFTPDVLGNRLASLFNLPKSLETAAECARRIGAPQAAERLADLVAEVFDGNGNRARRTADASIEEKAA